MSDLSIAAPDDTIVGGSKPDTTNHDDDTTPDLDLDDGDDLVDEYEYEPVSYGQAPVEPWLSDTTFDGLTAPSPRRLEVLTDDEATAWILDVSTWTNWMIATYRLVKWFPPCWQAHPALFEEAQALYLAWMVAWMPGTEGTAPLGWLRDLDAALSRIETRWQISCTVDEHRTPAPVPAADQHPVSTGRWWSNGDFNGVKW